MAHGPAIANGQGAGIVAGPYKLVKCINPIGCR